MDELLLLTAAGLKELTMHARLPFPKGNHALGYNDCQNMDHCTEH